jgi:DNA-binding transcriptional LysR family regulator
MERPEVDDANFAAVLRSRLRVKHFELFRNICKLRSLRKACVASNITQPSATKLVHEMEDMFGAPLFDRDRRGMQLTARGEIVRRHIEIVMADLGNLSNDLRLYSEEGNGQIRLGIIPSLSSPLLAKSIDSLLSAYPRARFQLREGATDQLLEELSRNNLDLTFGRVLDYGQSLDLRVTQIYTESFEVVCGTSHVLARLPEVSWEDVARENWVLPAVGSPFRELTDNLFTAHGVLRPVVTVASSSFSQIRHVIASGRLLGMLPRSIAQQAQSDGELVSVKLQQDISMPPISLITRKDIEQPPLITEFIQLVIESASALNIA